MSRSRAARAARLVLALLFSLPALALGAPVTKPLPRPAPAPPPPLPLLPSIARVRVEVLDRTLLVVEEVNLPRGDWKDAPLDFYVAFGAPGAPRAVDAQLVAVADGALEADASDAGEPVTLERLPRRPASAYPLLGRETMAGVVAHLKRESLARAFSPGGMATLRVRTALDLPDEDASGGRGVVVRLGSSRGTPLTLGRIAVVGRRTAGAMPSRAEAHLCGPEASDLPLAVSLTPRATPPGTPSVAIAPVLAVRHVTDDLCVRFW
ncbi:MAG: hypothetical protein JWP97_1797 [Labilithrix sp.]|nr:hypothetical protein [Labilithrix sp.]